MKAEEKIEEIRIIEDDKSELDKHNEKNKRLKYIKENQNNDENYMT